MQADGSDVELVVKFAGGCEGRTGALLREAVAALMAADLDLPVPEPFLVNLGPEFVATVPDTDDRYRLTKQHAAGSLGWNYGSKNLPAGFSTKEMAAGVTISNAANPHITLATNVVQVFRAVIP
jgi:hypothetical protein